MAAARSPVPVGPVGELTTPEYSNWLALGHALTTMLCQGLRPFIKRVTETFYKNLTLSAGPCTCVYVPRRKPNQYHDMSTCAWANILQAYHHGKPNWKQSDPAKWTDSTLGPWEIVKLFLPDLGGHANINSADDMDITGILNLMYWCNQFTVSQISINEVRETRNTKWVHVPRLELSDADKKTAFDAIENFLQVPQLAHDLDAQKALREIVTLKCVSDLHNVEAQVQAQFKEAILNEMSGIKSSLAKESRRNKKQRSLLEGRLHNMQTTLQNVNDRMKAENIFKTFVQTGVPCMLNYLVKCSLGIRRSMLTPWLVILLLCGLFTILDRRPNKDDFIGIGCYRDKQNRAIPTLEGTDPILDGPYKNRQNAVEKCAVAARRRGFLMFAVQNGGWCASSASAEKTFDKYGKSNDCKEDGEGGGWANNVYVLQDYTDVGCYKDTANRTISTLEGIEPILDGHYKSRQNAIAKCAVAARRRGFHMFAVQDGGWCAASATAEKTFDKYGKSNDCKKDGKGGDWANDVYTIQDYTNVGCYRDTADRAIPRLEGTDPILDGGYGNRQNAVARCADAARKRGFHMFAIQDGGWCASSATAEKTFDKYGESSDCNVDGAGGPWANNVYIIQDYTGLGCFRDTQDRAIPTLEATDPILDGPYKNRQNAVEKCAVAARRRGFHMFAVQNGGWCAASATAEKTFDKYGKSSDCKKDGKGGGWANDVYIIRDYSDVGCYKDTVDHAITPLEGEDPILDGHYKSRQNAVEKCAVAARRRGFHMFAVQDGGWCAASATAEKTFDKYGKSNDCQNDGEGGDFANNVYTTQDITDMCANSPCKNGATCVNLDGGFRCDCISGYTGNYCETDVDECANNPCKNGATCVNIQGSYRCVCKSGFSGNNCETQCSSHKFLEEGASSTSYSANFPNCKCDRFQLQLGWYKLRGAAETMMPTACTWKCEKP